MVALKSDYAKKFSVTCTLFFFLQCYCILLALLNDIKSWSLMGKNRYFSLRQCHMNAHGFLNRGRGTFYSACTNLLLGVMGGMNGWQ